MYCLLLLTVLNVSKLLFKHKLNSPVEGLHLSLVH